MIKQLLDHHWTMRRCSDGAAYEAELPTSVLDVLCKNHVIDDPYWRDNEDAVHGILEEDYDYTCTFTVDDAMLACPEVWLRFDGVDTIADLSVNETAVDTLHSMHRVWTYDVKSLLHAGENHLNLHFHSAFRAAEEAYAACPTRGSEDAWPGFSHIRKAHYMYGWDWGAHLPDMGIFRDVTLTGVDAARIDSVYVVQEHADGQVTLRPEVSLLPLAGDTRDYGWTVTITDPDGKVTVYEGSPEEIVITQPQLWWPNGMGAQPLYTLSVALQTGKETVDTWTRRIGLRTMTMDTSQDEYEGRRFAHCVNGRSVFAMGGDYIPEEHILPRKALVKTRQLLEDCVAANYNCVRVWGGGYYPDDSFYDLCDELGLMVWQDMMFACSMYELTPEFEANITPELIENVKRIRHHASLGLWCGNNEMEDFTRSRTWVTKDTEVRDYLIMYERLIPSILHRYDPQTFYWPSSPSSGGSFDYPQDPNRGDVHFWSVWHGSQPFTAYREHFFRYLSEFGFQALPSVQTVIEGISDDPSDQNLFSYIMERHQRNNAANGKIMNYMQVMYRYPENFPDLVYASQLLQADGIRYGVEHFRRNRGRCMGAVYWQTNDCWPVISWSSIDYYGRWKALHYYARRFFAPLMLSCEEQSWMSAHADVNRAGFAFEKSIRLNVTNESPQEHHVTVRWALRRADASVIEAHEEAVTVPAYHAIWLDKVEFPEVDLYSEYVSYELIENGEEVSAGTVIFGLPKNFHYLDPALQVRVEGDEIVVTARNYAKAVEILNDREDLVLTDNYFDMNAGEKRVKVLRKGLYGETNVPPLDPATLRVRSVYDIGRSAK